MVLEEIVMMMCEDTIIAWCWMLVVESGSKLKKKNFIQVKCWSTMQKSTLTSYAQKFWGKLSLNFQYLLGINFQ